MFTRCAYRGVSSEGDSLSEAIPFRAALRAALSDRNGGSAEFFNSLLVVKACGMVLSREQPRCQCNLKSVFLK